MTRHELLLIIILVGTTVGLAGCHPPVPTPVAPASVDPGDRPDAGTEQDR